MKIGKVILLLVLAYPALAFAYILSSTFDATRLTSTSSPSPQPPPPAEASRAVVEVYADPAQPDKYPEGTRFSVETFANDLRGTGLFKEVLMGRGHPEAALGFSVRSDEGAAKCGTPRLLSAATLGLWHSSSTYFHFYDFTVVAPEGRHIDVKKEYEGEVLSGLLALALRVSSSWSAPGEEDESSAVIVAALRRDLIMDTRLWALLRKPPAAGSPGR